MKLLVRHNMSDDDSSHPVVMTLSFRAGVSLVMILSDSRLVSSVSYLSEQEGTPLWTVAWNRDIAGNVKISKLWREICLRLYTEHQCPDHHTASN